MTPRTEPTAAAPLVLDGVGHAIRGARLGVTVQTERWNERTQRWEYGPGHAHLVFSLDIDVDDSSGEDGAAAPAIQSIPVVQGLGRTPRLEELAGVRIAVPDDDAWDAWYGNDAPPLEDNELTFGAWSPDGIALRWQAAWREGGKKPALVYAGRAAFAGIAIRLKAETDLVRFVEHLWGAGSLERFEVTRHAPLSYGPGMPIDRREWLPFTLWPRFIDAPGPPPPRFLVG